jgi:integrase
MPIVLVEMAILTNKKPQTETVKYLTDNELQALFRVIKAKRDICLFRLAYHRGLRASEVGLLSLEDLDRRDDAGAPAIFVHRLKHGKSGVFSLLPVELSSLRAWLKERGDAPGPLFPSRLGTPISQQMLDVLMKKYCKLAKIPRDKAHFHTLRHSCATSLLDRDEKIEYIAGHLGHRNIKNTMIYADVTDRKKRDVARRLRDWK